MTKLVLSMSATTLPKTLISAIRKHGVTIKDSGGVVTCVAGHQVLELKFGTKSVKVGKTTVAYPVAMLNGDEKATLKFAASIAVMLKKVANAKIAGRTIKLSKAELDAALAKLKLNGQKKILAKLGANCLRFLPAGIEVGHVSLMYWPFAYSSRNTAFATCWGKIDKFTLFSMLAAAKPCSAPPATRGTTYKGYAKCRVCGKNLGMADMVGTNITYPSDSIAHYKSHGLQPVLCIKTVEDAETGTRFGVMYIGTPKTIGNRV